MTLYFKKYYLEIITVIIAVAVGFEVYVIIMSWPVDYVTVAMLNIGQGDAIYIESPDHHRILIDGGPPHNLLGEVRHVVPFFERTFDAILVTNPDADHFAGFIDLLDRFTVDHVIEPGTHSETQTYKLFEQKITEKNIDKKIARRGMIINLGSNTYITILYPDRDISTFATNDGSIVAKLNYGSTSVMLTGDAPWPVEEEVLSVNGTSTIKSSLLKVGHHGSRTSSSKIFEQVVQPEYALISAGLNNSYGHPHKETIQTLNELHIPALVTFEEGRIIFHCTKVTCTRIY